MKKITFKSLSLLNFKGVKNLQVDFGENLTIISGTNGIGKTSIADAIMWVLFGTGYDGNKLEPKTYNKEYQIIPEIPHEATLELLCDGKKYVLKRGLYDSWKGDKCTNTYKYFINDEVCTAGEFKKCVDSICTEVTFRLCSSATDFVTRPWAEQRKFLQTLVPEITTDAITQGDAKYDFVLEALKEKDIESLLHHIRYKRSEIQKQLDEIPVRISELNKALPEVEEWKTLEVDIAEGKNRLAGINAQIANIKTGGAAQVRNEGIRKQLEFQRNRIDQMKKGARAMSSEEEVKHNSDLITSRTAKSKALSMVSELQAKMDGLTDTEVHIKQQLEELDAKKKEGAKQYDEVSQQQWQWDDNESFCPHCGQAYPIEKLLEIKRGSEDRFNHHKAQHLKELVALAGDIKAERIKCEEMLAQLEKDRTQTINQLTEARKALQDAEAHCAEVDKEEPKSYSMILAENDNYKQASEEAKRLEEELNKPTTESEEQQKMLLELEDRAKALQEGIDAFRTRLAKKETYEHVNSLLDECRKNKETYQNQIDELDEQLDVASEYYQHSCSLLEDEVNKNFGFVQWTLFKTNLDGEKKPFCECYHDGVPYSRLNGAAKVNAGIDIAYTIAQFYEVSVPMILDECESNLYPITKEGYQQIRLAVSPDEELQIKYSDGTEN